MKMPSYFQCCEAGGFMAESNRATCGLRAADSIHRRKDMDVFLRPIRERGKSMPPRMLALADGLRTQEWQAKAGRPATSLPPDFPTGSKHQYSAATTGSGGPHTRITSLRPFSWSPPAATRHDDLP